MKIIGITGTIGAGKGTIVDYLVRNKNYTHFSVREFLIEEIQGRGIDVNRDSMVLVANELRASHYPSYIIEVLYKRAKELGKDCVIESIRTQGEVEMLKKKENFVLIAVDASSEIRYNRIKKRNSETDDIAYSTFIADEQREIYSTDPNKQNLIKCIEMADYHINNDGDMLALYNQIENIISKI